MILKFFLFFLHGILAGKQCQDSSVYTCTECLMRAPNCAWCGDDLKIEDITKQRIKCGTESDLGNQGCSNIITKKSMEDVTSRKEDDISETVLISPQKLEASLRYGDPFTFKLKFTSPSHYPIDLYYLMDLSQSMNDDLENLGQLAKDLMTRMVQITGNNPDNIRIGLGSFVDKTVMPFVCTVPEKLENPCDAKNPCEKPYTYRNSMSLDKNVTRFEDVLKSIHSSSNLDAPEAGLDAMMQAIVCDDIVGWDKKRHKVLVYSSDATFHVAGDGKLGGILEPNDMKCHTEGAKDEEEYVEANNFDYPSIGQIIDVINREQILVIFAVTEDQKSTYQQLKNLLPNAEVGVLSGDSSNVIEIIAAQYSALRQKVELRNTLDIPGVSVNVRANCEPASSDGPGFVDGSVCQKIMQHETVEFEVEITWNGDQSCPKTTDINFSIFGVEAQTDIRLNFICDCGCTSKSPPNFPVPPKYLPKTENQSRNGTAFSCNGADYTTCGQCNCPANKIGNMCECDVESASKEDLYAKCTNPKSLEGDRKPCSGKSSGECICGRCHCHKFGGAREITGKYCECDNDVCHKDNTGRACGGKDHGTCNCEIGRCECNDGWEGDACTCPTASDTCINPDDPKLVSNPKEAPKPCSGKGDCRCGSCKCWDFGEKLGSYQGAFCERFNSQCENYEDCIRCIANAARTDTLVLDGDCLKHCISRDDQSEEYVYVHGLIYDSRTKVAKIDPDQLKSMIKKKADLPIGWDKNVENGKFCIGQDENNCQFDFKFEDKSDDNTNAKKISIIMQEERLCPQPPDPLIVAGSILGGVVLLGLIILALIKMIIWWISRREVKEWEKERGKNTITSGHNPLYEAPETRHTMSNVKYRPGYKSSAAH